jgi:hypothetical protein
MKNSSKINLLLFVLIISIIAAFLFRAATWNPATDENYVEIQRGILSYCELDNTGKYILVLNGMRYKIANTHMYRWENMAAFQTYALYRLKSGSVWLDGYYLKQVSPE